MAAKKRTVAKKRTGAKSRVTARKKIATKSKVRAKAKQSSKDAAPDGKALDVLSTLLAAANEVGHDELQSLMKAYLGASAGKPSDKPAEPKPAKAKTKAPKGKKAPSKPLKVTTFKNTKLNKAKLNWKEVWYTNCPMVSANNIDQELGWCREEFKKIGVEYDFLRHSPQNDWYPHYIHNLDNVIRFGGLNPTIAVHADIRRTVLLGATWVYEGGCMAVRAGDPYFRMTDLRGKKVGLTKSLNQIKNDWWRIQEHMGIENMLRLNGMTMDDVEIVEFPYADDWYNDPSMLTPINNPSELWLKRDHKHDLAFRPLESALLDGTVDAIYTQSKPFQHLQEATARMKMIEDLSRYPDWTQQVANTPAVITCTDVMAKEHPELVHAYMKAMVKVGRWANAHKRAASVILDRQTFYLDANDTYEGIKHVDMVPSLSAQNMACIKIGKDFMLKEGYIKRDFDVEKWAAPKFLEKAVAAVFEEEWEKKSWSKLQHGGGLEAKGRRLG